MTQYRITFYPSAETRVDPFELAWLLSKYDLNVVAKNEVPMLFVQAESVEKVAKFAHEVNRQFGALTFRAIEVQTKDGYVDIEATYA